MNNIANSSILNTTLSVNKTTNTSDPTLTLANNLVAIARQTNTIIQNTTTTQTTSTASASPKILGFGWVLFLLIILALLIFLISIYISQHKQGGLVIGAMSLAYSSIVMILYFMPKVPFGKTLLEPSVVDYSWHPRIFFVLVMIGSSLFGCLAAIGMYVFTPVYAISPEEEYH